MSDEFDLEKEKLKFERYKARKDFELRRDELDLRKAEARPKSWNNPLVIAFAAGAVGLLGNALVAWLNSRSEIHLEEQEAQSERVLEVIRSGDPETAAERLQFLLQTGLYTDRNGLLASYLENHQGVAEIFSAFTGANEANVGRATGDGTIDAVAMCEYRFLHGFCATERQRPGTDTALEPDTLGEIQARLQQVGIGQQLTCEWRQDAGVDWRTRVTTVAVCDSAPQTSYFTAQNHLNPDQETSGFSPEEQFPSGTVDIFGDSGEQGSEQDTANSFEGFNLALAESLVWYASEDYLLNSDGTIRTELTLHSPGYWGVTLEKLDWMVESGWATEQETREQ